MLRVFLINIVLIFNLKGVTIKDAHEAAKKGDIQTAIKLYKEIARKGDPEGAFKLGTIYFKGKGVKRDLDKAIRYFNRAAATGHNKAKYNQGIILSNKRYKKHNFKKAFEIFYSLAIEGNPKAQNMTGIFLTYGYGVDKDYKKAVRWFEKSYFENNYFPASCNLAFMFADGRGVFPNFGRANLLALEGYEKKLPMCVRVFKDYNLHKYTEDKGVKYGYYKRLN